MTFWTEKRLLWLIILAYIAFFGIFTSFRHYNFQTQTWDMGIFAQTFWNTIHGKIMQNTLEEIPKHLGVHFSPFLFLLVPGYLLFPSPYFLLWIQTIALALGAWPLYLLAKQALGTAKKPNWPLILSIGYLLYPSLHWINTFDFHPIAFLIPLLLTAFYFLQTKKWTWGVLFLALAAGTQEDAILAVAFTGLYLLFKPKEKKIGLAIFIISILYFLIAVKIIMPALGGGLLRLDRYAQFGKTPAEMISNIFHQPLILINTIFSWQKLRYIFWLFLPVAFLPLFSRYALILLIPGLGENLLTNFGNQTAGFYQYDAMLIAGIFIAAIYGLKNLLNKWPEKIKILKSTIVAAFVIGYFFKSPVNPIFFPMEFFKSNPQWEAFRKMVRLVPPNASVSANTNLVPHLANREYVYMLGSEPFPADYVLIDGADQFGFSSAAAFQKYVDGYVKSGQYNIQSIDNRYFVFAK